MWEVPRSPRWSRSLKMIPSSFRKKRRVDLHGGRITIAGGRFQTGSVNHRDLPPYIPNKSSFLQHPGCNIHRGSSHAEHMRKKLLSEWKGVFAGSIMSHQ